MIQICKSKIGQLHHLSYLALKTLTKQKALPFAWLLSFRELFCVRIGWVGQTQPLQRKLESSRAFSDKALGFQVSADPNFLTKYL